MSNGDQVIKIFTIGFAQKNAEQFFKILEISKVKKVVDIRLNNESQLAGFTKKNDLKYFLKVICKIDYEYRPEFAPTKDILDDYKKKIITWTSYETKYNTLIKGRDAQSKISPENLDMACLLCSEPTADKCHRRLLAEYFKETFKHVLISHL